MNTRIERAETLTSINKKAFKLKLGYFLKEFKKKLFLIGTEKKGVLIANMLQEEKVPFRWFAHDRGLIGQKKRDVVLENIFILPPEGICILSVYPKKNQRNALKDFIRERGYKIGETAHFF